MGRIKVLVSHSNVREEDLAMIAGVDPSVEAVRAVFADEATLQNIQAMRAKGVEFLPDLRERDFPRQVAEAEVILGGRLPKDILQIAPKLRWVHSLAAGVEGLAGMGLLENGIRITNSSGVNAPPAAESVIMYLLMWVKEMPTLFRAQERREWAAFLNEEIGGKTLGIVGPGRIGVEIARLASAFGMRVLAVRRRYTPGMQLPYVHALYPRRQIQDMLRECDFVAVAVSLTPETRHMIGEREFAAMKPGAFFVNIARGPVVDEAALLRALQSGHLGGAALDVFESEPLSSSSEFWVMPNVIVTPHVAGRSRHNTRRATEFFCQNLRRYVAGQPLENLVDPQAGY